MNVFCSIIIPVYNGEAFLHKTIESCLSQSYKALEIIVVDDCSTDNSFKIASSYENIRVFRNSKNMGIIKTANYGITVSKGELLLFLGHDDLLSSEHIEKLVPLFSNSEISFVHCNSHLINSKGDKIGLGRDDTTQIKRMENIVFELAKNNFIHSTGAMIRKRSLLECGGFDEKFRNYGEWLLWLRLLNYGKAFYCSEVRAFYRRHESNITNTFKNIEIKKGLFEYKKICLRYGISIVKDKRKRLLLVVNYFFFKLKCFFS